MAKKTVHYFEVAEVKDGFLYAYIKGFPTETEARANVATRAAGNWIVNKIEGYYKTNGAFKRTNCTTI